MDLVRDLKYFRLLKVIYAWRPEGVAVWGRSSVPRMCGLTLYLYIGIIVKIKGKSVVYILALFIKFFHVNYMHNIQVLLLLI